MIGYGKELILDIHSCDTDSFTRDSISNYLSELCELIDMEAEDLHFWDYEDEPWEYDAAPDHLKGISCTQFIRTSTIVVHTLDVLEKAFINIFSCKDFNAQKAADFTAYWFGGEVVQMNEISRI